MMEPTKKYLYLCIGCVCALLTLPGFAQEKSEEKDKRLVKVMFYGAPAGAADKAYVYQRGGDPQEVTLDKYNFSDSIELKKETAQIAFLPHMLSEDEPVPTGAPVVKVPPSWNRILILVSEDKGNKVMPIKMLPINASQGAFGSGEVAFMNFSEMTVFGKVGDKKLVSKPRSKEVVKSPASSMETYMVVLDTYKDSIEKRRRLVQQKCQFNPAARVLTLVLPMPPPRMVKLYSAPINDF